jgi:hypothetical protein
MAIRWRRFSKFYEDDIFIYFALAETITMAILYHYAIPPMYLVDRVGAGLESPGPDFTTQGAVFLKLQFALIIMFWSALWTVKFSFLLLLRRILFGTQGLMIYWWIVTVIVIMAYVGCIITQLTSCEPISSYFVIGGCQTDRDVFVSNLSLHYATAVDIISDVLIMALPIPMFWKLKVNLKQKIVLFSIFSLGVIVIIFAIVRVIETNPLAGHVDPVWLAVWSMVESSVAVVVACLPALRFLFSDKDNSQAYSQGTKSNLNTADRHGAIRLHDMSNNNSAIVTGQDKPDTASMEELFPKDGVRVQHEYVCVLLFIVRPFFCWSCQSKLRVRSKILDALNAT